MYIFTMPAADWDETLPDKRSVLRLIQKHRVHFGHLANLMNYYEGKHAILADEDRSNKLVCNHAKDISDTASAYFIGNPISYNSTEDITPLTDALEAAGADEADGDNGLDLSIFGRAYEYIYTQEDSTELAIKNLSPLTTFMVRDDSIEERELFAVYYYEKKDDTDNHTVSYVATILTKNYKYVLNIMDTKEPQALYEEPEEHFMGEVPVVEYFNNKLAIGDFELQIPLIDAYNALMSDRITDKEQFIDAILAVYGTLLADEDAAEEGDGGGAAAAMKKLKQEKLLEMPDASRAEYLTRTFDESGVEILKKAIEQDIHKFSHVPCLTDEAFGGNVSGVAMEFKLLGLENITKIKSRYYRKGLRKRLRIFVNFLNTSGVININVAAIEATFTRAMPKNLLEISQYVANLKGVVSTKTLLSQIPFVTDPEAEIEAVKEENAEVVRQQQELFSEFPNTAPEEDEVDEQ